ncbi:hypothetical protein [Paenibacillus popilliae]|uniref:hypothetical protein n=1 Tax=Paenibacillus popilliae TaxID=78057 RepID=UPI0011D26135|nr:hypothetical protein [Paenibacillus popilliae]
MLKQAIIPAPSIKKVTDSQSLSACLLRVQMLIYIRRSQSTEHDDISQIFFVINQTVSVAEPYRHRSLKTSMASRHNSDMKVELELV